VVAVVFVAAVIGTILVRAAASGPSSAKGAIAGVVTNPTGQPVAGMRVDVYMPGQSQPVRESLSAVDGSFNETNLATGVYHVYYFPSSAQGGWLSGWYKSTDSEARATAVHVSAPKTTRVTIALSKAATITGKVTDPAGHPVAGIGVWAYEAGTANIAWETQSAADGSFSDVNLASGTYDVYYFSTGAWKSGWYRDATNEATATPVKVVAPTAVTIAITLQRTS
jgi:hypothetical protein